MSNYKTVFFTLGILLIILGVAMMVPVVFQLIYNEFDSTFITSGIITITFGILFFLSNIDHLKLINTQQAFLLTALSWLCIATFGSLPFFFSELDLSITDSFFESMSGITTTGATILNNIESSPKGILMWRSMLQWLGGIGVILIPLSRHLLTRSLPGSDNKGVPASEINDKILPSLKYSIMFVSFFFSWNYQNKFI